MSGGQDHCVLISTSSFGAVGEQPLELLAQAGVDIELNPYGRKLERSELIELLRGKEGLIAGTETLDRGVLTQVPTLRVISRCGTGLDNVDLDAARQLGIAVESAGEAHAQAVAELVLGGMLAALRQIPAADRSIRNGSWEKPMGSLLFGKTVGLVGFGRVGRALAALLQPFEVELLAADPKQDRAAVERHGARFLELEALLSRADLVSLHLPYTAEVHHMLDGDRLALIKRGGVVVNAARGGLIDERALAERLHAGELGGAFIDTFEREPYSGPLTDAPAAVLTPHIGSYAAESRFEMELAAVRNLLRHVSA